MSHFRPLSTLFFVLAFLGGMPALADKGAVELKMVVEKEIKIKDENGKIIVKRVGPKRVLPGDELIYIIRYSNSGEEEAVDVVINNPIQTDLRYTADSAYGQNAEIRFSIDGGKKFDVPENLMVKMPDGTERPAVESDYTNIRWILNKPIAPKGGGQVGYRVRVK